MQSRLSEKLQKRLKEFVDAKEALKTRASYNYEKYKLFAALQDASETNKLTAEFFFKRIAELQDSQKWEKVFSFKLGLEFFSGERGSTEAEALLTEIANELHIQFKKIGGKPQRIIYLIQNKQDFKDAQTHYLQNLIEQAKTALSKRQALDHELNSRLYLNTSKSLHDNITQLPTLELFPALQALYDLTGSDFFFQFVNEILEGNGAFTFSKNFSSALKANNNLDIQKVLAPLSAKMQNIIQINTLTPNTNSKEENDASTTTRIRATSFITDTEQFIAAYQTIVLQSALKKALLTVNSPGRIRFDTAGHVLLEYIVTDTDLDNLYRQATGKEQSDAQTRSLVLQQLSMMGLHHPRRVFCKLDVRNTLLSAVFREQIKDQLSQQLENQSLESSLAQAVLNTPDIYSCIPLQEETEMHMRLISRVLEKHMQNISPEFWDEIREEAAIAIWKAVRRVFVQGLLQCITTTENSHVINVAKLNVFLDNERVTLANVCRRELLRAGRDNVPDFLQQYEKISQQLHKHEFETTTATSALSLYTDFQNASATLTTGTEETAHNKGIGRQAAQLIKRSIYEITDMDNIVVTTLDKAEVRAPSLGALPTGLSPTAYTPKSEAERREYGEDVAKKIHDIYTDIKRSIKNTKPIIYNLLTSYHIEPDRNNQENNANIILLGAHLYNRHRLQENNTDEFCFVQNIPVNQHGYPLSYQLTTFGNASTINEATLMAEIALLYTLCQSEGLPASIIKQLNQYFNDVNICYRNYLASDNNDFFFNTMHGQLAIRHLHNFKNIAPKNLKAEINDPIATLVSKSLLQLFTHNKHLDLQYGMLIQALSVFTEPLSIAGCKSANERYQSVAGRVEVLTAISNKIVKAKVLSPEEQTVLEKMRNMIAEPLEANFAQLQIAMDLAYNAHLYGASSSISPRDQGHGSKLETLTEPNHRADAVTVILDSISTTIKNINTNKAESARVTNLSHEHTGKLQAHKCDHPKELKAAYEDVKQQKVKTTQRKHRKQTAASIPETEDLQKSENPPEDKHSDFDLKVGDILYFSPSHHTRVRTDVNTSSNLFAENTIDSNQVYFAIYLGELNGKSHVAYGTKAGIVTEDLYDCVVKHENDNIELLQVTDQKIATSMLTAINKEQDFAQLEKGQNYSMLFIIDLYKEATAIGIDPFIQPQQLIHLLTTPTMGFMKINSESQNQQIEDRNEKSY